MRTARLLFVVTVSVSTLLAASRPAVRARNGMVVTSDPHATAVGVEVLRRGGNAVDAAVAVGFALAVTYPQAGNIGGGGFMVIRMADGRTTTIDYREEAPGGATRDMYLRKDGTFDPSRSTTGSISAGVPGSVAGMLLALEKFGSQSRAGVIAPAIRLAAEGFPVHARFAENLNGLLRRPAITEGTRRTFGRAGVDWHEGDTLVQPDLAMTLRRISENGRDEFYRGQTADLIVQQMRRGGGLITLDDLRNYHAVERAPVRGSYRGYDVISMGPPSAGGVALLQLLHLLEPMPVASDGFNSSATIAIMAEAMKLVYADRAQYLGDSDHVRVPVEQLLSMAYADLRRVLMDTVHAVPSSRIAHGAIPPAEGMHTTHFSVIDRWGNAVCVTTTINDSFGSGVVVDGAGFLLNNEMDDFSAKPGVPNMYGVTGGEANAIAPHKRMLSSMAPTIVLRDGQPELLLGSPGGSTIITTVLQVILNVIDHRMPLQEAVDAPRIHHQWLPDTVWYEKRGLAADVVQNLRRRGYTPVEREGTQGLVEAIRVDRRRGWYEGASDPRGYGTAQGY
jgi:gamma-glutamyltranspeptidase/glutathione hydrolase